MPGPTEVKNLNNYTNSHFFLAADTTICFNLNAAEQGTTAHTHFVRSELRHLLNWETNSRHEISATVRVTSNQSSYKVTVVQIHGITADNENVPPLLRVSMVDGNVMAYLKSDSTGDKTEKIVLVTGIGTNFFDVKVKMQESNLVIMVNGKELLRRNLSYWKYMNYFKLGCYPQSIDGQFKIYFKHILVS